MQWIAALLILSHPMLNQNRSAIMRDPIYWALIVLAMREILLYLRRPAYRHALRWLGYIATAALFRFEGLFFAFLSPFCLLFVGNMDRRLRHTVNFLLPVLLTSATVFALATFLLPGAEEINRRIFPTIGRYIDGLLAFPASFGAVVDGSAEVLLEYTARDDASVAVIAAFAAIVVLNLIRALTWPYLAVLLWGWRAKLWQRIKPGDSVVIVWHMSIGLLYLWLFMLINQFVLERYAKQIIVFMLLYLPLRSMPCWTKGHSAGCVV